MNRENTLYLMLADTVHDFAGSSGDITFDGIRDTLPSQFHDMFSILPKYNKDFENNVLSKMPYTYAHTAVGNINDITIDIDKLYNIKNDTYNHVVNTTTGELLNIVTFLDNIVISMLENYYNFKIPISYLSGEPNIIDELKSLIFMCTKTYFYFMVSQNKNKFLIVWYG